MANKIVIIGGMGPQASLYFHKLIIDNAAKSGANDNADYPEVIHFSIPVKDFINADDSQPALDMIKSSLSNISVCRNDLVFLTCNTAHLLKNEIETSGKLTITPLMGAIGDHLSEKNYSGLKIGVLASPTTIKSELYSSEIRKQGNEVIAPSLKDQNKLEKIIRSVLANKNPKKYEKDLNKIIKNLKSKGSEKIVVGCTELSVVLKDSRDKSLLDPLKLLIDQKLNHVELLEEFNLPYKVSLASRKLIKNRITRATHNKLAKILTSS